MSPSFRVLQVTPYYEPAYVYGGPTRSVPALCRALVEAGAYTAVFTTTANGREELDLPANTPIERNGVQVTYFRRRSGSSRFHAHGMAPALRASLGSFDLVHITGVWTYPAAVAAREAIRLGVPYIVSPRGMLMPWELHHKRWKKAPYLRLRELPRLRRSAGVHCTTEIERDALAVLGLQQHAFVVPNVVDASEFSHLPARGALRTRLGTPPDACILLYLGRLHAKKGIPEAIDLVHRLTARGHSAHLVLAGPDDGVPFRAPGSERGNVHLVGPLDAAGRLQAFADADLFVSLSASENFGLSVAEAMAAGLPVVVRSGTGLGSYVLEAGAGLVVGEDREQVANSVSPLIADSECRREMGRRGRSLVSTAFAPRRVAAEMLSEYRRIVEHTHQSRGELSPI